MPNVKFTPDLSSLEQDYQILTELHSSGDSHTYLARHLRLNRDVTVTVIHAGDAADFQMLTQFAADTRILAKARHPNIVPVIEGRMLASDTFAIVRARVRGSTLHQLVGEVGPLPLPRSALNDIFAALEWARKGGIFHRRVSPDDVVFQQGSGRVLLAFDPAVPTADAAWDRCADARTIGRLAWEMLAGRPNDNSDPKSLAELRPDLPTRVIDETNALMNCRREGHPPNILEYIALLGSPPSVLSATMASTRTLELDVPSAPSAPLTARSFTPMEGRPTGDAVIIVKQGLGFNTRLALAAAVLAVIVLVVLLIVSRTSSDGSLSASGTQRPDTTAQAAGEVVSPRRLDAALATNVDRPAATDSSPGPADACSSPELPDQRACLRDAIQRGDVPVNRAYQQLIAALRIQAGATQGEPDPSSVAELRDGQTTWRGEREAACSGVGVGPLYAKARAQCYAGQAAKRIRELQDMIDEIPKL
jgi:uncharacterized protein YecT (DUF1311 family)